MERLSHDQVREILSTIDLNDNGQETVSKLSSDSLVKLHNGLQEMSGVDTQYADSKIHAKLIEAELKKRNIDFKLLNW